MIMFMLAGIAGSPHGGFTTFFESCTVASSWACLLVSVKILSEDCIAWCSVSILGLRHESDPCF
jgi:hypothetical protein